MRPHPLKDILLINHSYDVRLGGVNLKVVYFAPLTVFSAAIHQTIAIGRHPTRVVTFTGQLFHPCPGTDRDFDTLAGRLPKLDVVEQFVYMVIEPLFPFLDAPYRDPIANKLLYHKRCFVIPASQAIKHKYQQDVKLPAADRARDLLDGVPLLRGYFEP